MKPSEITRPLLLLIFPIFLTACHDSPTKPRDRPSLDLAEVINVVWNLQGQSIAGAAVDLTFYDPFHLVYGAGEYFGDDGCNSFFGTYEIRSDSILPKSEGMTTMSCVDNSFSLLPLISPYKVQLTGDELKIFRHDTSYIYASAFTKSLAGSPLPGKVWILTACNDPEFEPLRSQGALPKVSFYEDRRFQLNWFCVDGNHFGCNQYQGVFGIGENNSIFFYRKGSSGSGNTGLRFVFKLMKASRYAIAGNKLTLFHTSDSTAFEFIAE